MAEWKFRCFLSTHGKDLIDQWITALPVRARARFLDVVTALRDLPREDWSRPEFALLSGLGRPREQPQTSRRRKQAEGQRTWTTQQPRRSRPL